MNEPGAGDVGEFHGTGETLVFLRVILLQADLKFDGFQKPTFLFVASLVLAAAKYSSNSFAEGFGLQFAHDGG